MAGTCERPNHLPCRTAQTVAAFKKLLREAATEATHTQNTAREKSRKCLIFFGLRHFQVGSLWRAKSRSLNSQQRPDTHCGNVNPHRHMQVGACRGAQMPAQRVLALQSNLDVPVRWLRVEPTEERAG